MRRIRMCLLAMYLALLCFGTTVLNNASSSEPPQMNGDSPLQETLTWLEDKLPVYAKQRLEVRAANRCVLAITYKVDSADLSQAKVYIPLADLDFRSVRVSRSGGSDAWALNFHTLEDKPSIRFMLYQGIAAEGGQKSEETILIADQGRAKKVAQVLRQAIKLCVEAEGQRNEQ